MVCDILCQGVIQTVLVVGSDEYIGEIQAILGGAAMLGRFRWFRYREAEAAGRNRSGDGFRSLTDE